MTRIVMIMNRQRMMKILVSDDEEEESSNRPTKRRKVDNRGKLPFQRMRMFRRDYLKAWLAVLRLPLPLSSLKQALHFLPKNVLHYVSHPLRFADFFMQAYSDHDSGVIGVLALGWCFHSYYRIWVRISKLLQAIVQIDIDESFICQVPYPILFIVNQVFNTE